jgi:hypothetical protein
MAFHLAPNTLINPNRARLIDADDNFFRSFFIPDRDQLRIFLPHFSLTWRARSSGTITTLRPVSSA